jgi:hypothetical protein
VKSAQPRRDENLEVAREIAKAFKENGIRRRLPPGVVDCGPIGVVDCGPIATSIITVRNYLKKPPSPSDKGLAKRRATVKAVQKLVADQKKRLSADPLPLSGTYTELQWLTVLEHAIANAAHALLWPYDPKEGLRSTGWWHKGAGYIAEQIRESMQHLGHRRVSFQKHGKLILVMSVALRLATGKNFASDTISSALRKVTN